MKAHNHLTIAGVVLLLYACSNPPSAPSAAYSYVHLPADALPTCTVPLDSFKTWFRDGKVAKNGFVTPAGSDTFGHLDNCEFYQWSERMFLWITSPDSGTSGTVMQSPVFYTVSPPDSTGARHLIKHEPGQLLRATSNLQKDGPDRLPLFRAKNGRLYEVVVHKPGEKVMVKNQLGKAVELGSVEKGANGIVLFRDKTGKPVEQPKPLLGLRNPAEVLQEFQTANGPVFVDANGRQVDSEAGQATGDVLMSQNGSLVYYITMVNNMYAYFLTAVNKKYHYMAGNQFPTTIPEMDSIIAFARINGYPITADTNALAMEIKTSWVIADSLTDTSRYVIIDAIVPTYDKVSSTLWVPKSEKKVRLALTGIHVVGSVAGHPEMIWATFEHESNTPNAAYQYIDKNSQVQTVPADTGTGWLFNGNASAPASTFNISHMIANGDTIIANAGQTISPSNTLQEYPWGTAMHTVPNQQDTSASASNTEIISINNSIRDMIPVGDVRKNYLLIGATWTFGGTPPNGAIYPADSTSGGAIGTSLIANSTMETYFQSDTTTCFTCHQSLDPSRLSHVFRKLQPLPVPAPGKNTGMRHY
ncbi:hypothetical protein [Dinghuibacter silviterrae]|uniref:Uncharacterized protein n=1 Tax=Dinghuibacter silviterrae TaxID=1539049 RepID=A0A4R8DQW2_9BACT|nr:hypothetical protein [Dinghuibacter silviterrae]TDX00339.1 hypothetical protein EDB95_1360 [Dinghuibacter silviterrae]